ncbi:hypothetical protein BDW02DRAFT_466171, partial [Decorospora gaudefroyi]
NGLELYLQENKVERPSYEDVYQWLLDDWAIEPYVKLWVEKSCRSSLCPYLDWQGNSDIAGVGVRWSLISVYLPILLAIRFDWVPESASRLSVVSKTLLAVQHSTSTFLNASFVFSMSMLVAALVSFAQHASTEREDWASKTEIRKWSTLTESAWALSILLPISSVLPVVLLHLGASNILRRVQGRKILWASVAVLISVVVALNCAYRPDSWYHDDEQTRFEDDCLDRYMEYIPLIVRLTWSLAGLLVLGITGYVIASLVFTLRNWPAPAWWIRISRPLWFMTIAMTFCAMWLCLGWLMYFQRQLSKARAGGDDNKDAEWSFGQILALATWVPFLVEFVYLLWEEPSEALSGRLMDPYEVVETSKKPEAFELRR